MYRSYLGEVCSRIWGNQAEAKNRDLIEHRILSYKENFLTESTITIPPSRNENKTEQMP